MSNSVNEEITNHGIAVRDYNFMKHTLNVIIDNNTEIILLVGSGNNGKTHLINEMSVKLIEHDYEILHECPIDKSIFENFEQLLKSYKKKIIMTSIVNPYTYYTNAPIVKPNNIIVLDMEHIEF